MYKLNATSNNNQRFCVLLCLCLLIILTNCKPAIAEENKQPSPEASSKKIKSNDPYCGLYCLYATMKLADKEIDFRELIKPEYLSSSKGSSLAELKKAAEDYGMNAVPVGNLTTRMLEHSPYPIILHVKSSVDKKEYDHFELLLGTENGKAKLLGPPEPIRFVPFHELVPLWDGVGLVVSENPIKVGAILAPVRKRLLAYITLTIAFILTVHLVKRRLSLSPNVMSRPRFFGLSLVQSAGFILVAILWGLIYHFTNDLGFLAHANATSSIKQTHSENFIPKVTKNTLTKLVNTDTVIIDARFARDYASGHLEGAINLPIDANDIDRQKIMANIAKNAHIVIYCQSKRCPYAYKVTSKLKTDGYSDISIYKGGWLEWTKANEN